MRKFTTIFVAVVLCIAAFAVCASAASNTKCEKGVHDWSAYHAVAELEDGTIVMERTCVCGLKDSYTIAPAHVCELTYVPAAPACHVPGIAEYWVCADCEAVYADAEGKTLTNRKNLEIAPDCELAYVPAAEACHVAGTAEYWYCPECDAVYSDAEGTTLTNRKNLEIAPVCELTYTAKVEPTATEDGMNEYWYCAGCDCYFTDAEGKMNIARLSLVIPALGGEAEHKCTIAYVPATEACHVPGCAEYWYCTDATCGILYADEALTQVSNRKNLETPAVVELVHQDAVAACHANGYLEHWYCPKCDAYFADAEATQLTNIKNLTVEGDLSKLAYTAKVEATATENGMNEYWYCEGCNCFFTDAEGKYNIAYLSLTIPATGEVEDPNGSAATGDNAIFFVAAIVAVATLGVAAVSFKKREN